MCLTQGLTTNCDQKSVAGITDKIYLATCQDMDFTGWVVGVSGEITTLAVDVAGGFYEYEIKHDSGGYTGEFDGEAPNLYLTQTVTIVLSKLDQERRNVIMEMVNCNCGMVAVVEDNNCKKWVLGVNYNETCSEWKCRGLRVASGTTETTGIDPTADQNEYTITLTATVFELAREFTGTVPLHP
jgi:hypothetical protein